MGSSFFGLNIGQQGLYTAQTSLNITSHNIANAETEGYSRQYAVQKATNPLKNGPRGMIGTGSEIITVKQHRDDYLDDKYWDMANEMGEYEKKDELLSQLELILNEPSDSGYSVFFNDIFDSLQTLSTDPSNTTARSAYVDSLSAFTSYMNDIGEQLLNVQEDANFGIKTSVNQINYFAQELATLNGQIGNLELGDDTANDLRDERNRIIDELSKVINVDITEMTDSFGKETFRVSINGQILVDDVRANYLETRPRATFDNPEDGPDMYDIYWASGRELYFNHDTLSGELKGYLDVRDGNNGENFKGDVLAGEGTNTVTISNPSRTDIPLEGELNINGVKVRYNSFVYNDVTDTIEFNLGDLSGADGQTIYMEDINGNDVSDTVTWNAGSPYEIVLDNPASLNLPEYGEIMLNGVVMTYTDYDEVTGRMTIAAPVGSDGNPVEIGDDLPFKGVPYYLSQLNEFVRTIAKEFNQLNHSGNGGTGLAVFAYEGYTGTADMETGSGQDYEQITIHNFVVNDAVLDDPGRIENSKTAGNGESANDLILDFIDKRHDVGMFDKGEPDNFMQSMIGELGIDAKQNAVMMRGQEDLLSLIQNQRLSVSGVDMNEETSNLIKFQNAYNLSAQVISVMNEIYDVTINGMGV